MKVRVANFRPFERNTLQGFVDVTLVDIGLVLHDCTLHAKGEKRWVGMPGKPWVDGDGKARRDEHGKIIYSASVSWFNHGQASAFSAAVVDALSEKVAA